MLHTASLSEIITKLKDKALSVTELAQHFLSRIEQHDKQLNSFISVNPEQVLTDAKAMQSAMDMRPLAGIPIAYKDNISVAKQKMTCASKMLADYVAPYDATLVRYGKENGLLTLGKTNLDEFAFGSTNEHSYFGAVSNPWDLARVPGGSSGGSAASVAAGLTPVAIGSDTGGSIRQPAAFCGISGFKPSYGLVSRYGLTAFASSLDQAGPMARRVEDIALVMDAISGHDPLDSTSLSHPKPGYYQSLDIDLKGIKIGLAKEFFEGLDDEIHALVKQSLAWYESQGAELVEVSMPHLSLAVPCYYIIAPAEASSNLSRFDGVRYGHRSEKAASLQAMYSHSRAEGFGEEVTRRLLAGTYVLSHGYYDAYFIKAQQIRQLIADDCTSVFKQVDFLMTPTTPSTAFTKGACKDNITDAYLADIYTSLANLAGLPALSIPIGFSKGLPVGGQLMGPRLSDGKLLAAAHQFQLAHDFHLQQPQTFLE